MASCAKPYYLRSMDSGGSVDMSVHRELGGYVDILDPLIMEDVSRCRYFGCMDHGRFVDMSVCWIHESWRIGLSICRGDGR